MKKIMLAVVASMLMFAASADAQPRKQVVGKAPSAEQIAQKRSAQQAKVMHLDKTQYERLYKLNLKAAKMMQQQMQKSRKEADKYKSALLKIVGCENMKMYEASRMRDRRELQRGSKDGRPGMKDFPMKPGCQSAPCKKGPDCVPNCRPEPNKCPKAYGGKPCVNHPKAGRR